MCGSMYVDIQSATPENRRGNKEQRKLEEEEATRGKNIMAIINCVCVYAYAFYMVKLT